MDTLLDKTMTQWTRVKSRVNQVLNNIGYKDTNIISFNDEYLYKSIVVRNQIKSIFELTSHEFRFHVWNESNESAISIGVEIPWNKLSFIESSNNIIKVCSDGIPKVLINCLLNVIRIPSSYLINDTRVEYWTTLSKNI